MSEMEMSESMMSMGGVPSIHYARVIDTRLEAVSSNKVVYVLEEGSATTSYNPLQSSSHSLQNTSFNLNNIATYTARDSRLTVTMQCSVTITCQNTTAGPLNIINSDNFGLRQYSLNRGISNINHQINQASRNMNTNDILDGIARINLYPEMENFYENTMPDFVDSYSAASGTNFSPLASYSSSLAGDGVFKPRTTGWFISSATGSNTLAAGASGSVVLTVNFYEPLITPFTNISKAEKQALYAITGEFISINWVPDLFNNMFCFFPGALTLLNGVVAFTNSAQLNCIYLTPKDNTILQVPKESVYPYNEYSIFSNNITQGVPVAAFTQVVNVNSQVCNFTNVPYLIMVYARLSNNSRTCQTADKYLTIQNLTCTMDNGLPQLAGANVNQLFDISVRNGLVMPRPCFRGDNLTQSVSTIVPSLYGCGSVLVINPALDLSLKSGDTTGSPGRYIFNVSNATFINNTATAFPTITLYVVGINKALLRRVGSQYNNSLLQIPGNVVDICRGLPAIAHQEYKNSKHSNGFFFGGGVSDLFKKAYAMGTTAYDFGKSHYGDLKDAYNIGKKLVHDVQQSGAGMGKSRLFGSMVRPNKQSSNIYYQ